MSTVQRRLVRGNKISGNLSEFRNKAKHSTKPLTPGYIRTVRYLPGHRFLSDDSLMSTPCTARTQSRLLICVPVEMNKALSLEMIEYNCSYWKYHFKSQSSALWFVNKEKTLRGTFFTSFITGWRWRNIPVIPWGDVSNIQLWPQNPH